MPIDDTLANVAATVCKLHGGALVRELGAGAHKRAYLMQLPDRAVALKIAPITPSLLPRFEREAEALKGCSHPAIARLHNYFSATSGDKAYWVSFEEYLPGGTLASLASRGKIENTNARRIGISLAHALVHLKERNLVHRDIKPDNILFRDSVTPVLTDFGIVRMLDAPTLTQDFLPQGPGTPLYAAPEQLLNETDLIDWRTDQFGLAMVIAEVVLNHYAFSPEGDAPLAVGRVVRREQLPTRSQVLLRQAGFSSLIKALQPWPIMRFRSPDGFISALAEIS